LKHTPISEEVSYDHVYSDPTENVLGLLPDNVQRILPWLTR